MLQRSGPRDSTVICVKCQNENDKDTRLKDLVALIKDLQEVRISVDGVGKPPANLRMFPKKQKACL